MKEVILKLKTLLPASEFIVVGSYALSQYGLIPRERVSDLDIVLVKPEPTATFNMLNLMKDFPAKSTKALQSFLSEQEGESELPAVKKVRNRPPKTDCKGIFMFDKVKVDVFIVDEYTDRTLVIDGVKYATIPHIVKAKMSSGRMKDWLQCRDMARLVFVPEAFEAMLNTTWRSTLKLDY